MARLLRLIGVGIVGLAYALVFGEVFMRLLAPQPLVPRYVTGSPDGVRANIPNVAFRQWTPDVDVTVRYNSAGMRDDRPPPPLVKPLGECRVVLLGDSYFVGFESDYPHSFAKQLEDRLQATGRNCRVLDFAVSGFGTGEMLIALKARALAYHPDVVVMSWHATDPVDNIRSGLFTLDHSGRLTRSTASFLPGIGVSDALMKIPGYRWLIENCHLYSAVRERTGVLVKSTLARMRTAAFDKAQGLPNDDETPTVTGMARPGSPPLDAALIFAVRDVAKANGARMLLFDVPSRHSRTEFVSMFQWLSPDVLEGVAVVDPVKALHDAAGPDRPVYLEHGQLHWTALGNAVAAQVAADEIIRRGWVDQSTTPGGPSSRR